MMAPRTRSADKENPAAQPAPPRKRLKKSEVPKVAQAPSRHRGNRGKLASMLKMPMEVFSAIASNLSPLDLLHMSRCSKGLHALLTSKSSKPIWAAARANLSVPDCPKGWSEPKYAKLLFENECNGCGKRTTAIDYYLRVRYCFRACDDIYIGRARTVVDEEFDFEVDGVPLVEHSEIYSLVPYDCSLEDFCQSHEDLAMPQAEAFSLRRYNRKDFVDAVNEYITLSGDERRHIVERKEAEVKEVLKHGRLLYKWAKEFAKVKSSEKQRNVDEREREIKRRLVQEGFSESHLDLLAKSSASAKWKKLVCSDRPLTDRSWKLLLPKLQALYDVNREEILETESERNMQECCENFLVHYNEFLTGLTEEEVRFAPSIGDIIHASFFKKLLKRKDATTVVTKEQFEGRFKVPLQEFMVKHERKVHARLTDLIGDAYWGLRCTYPAGFDDSVQSTQELCRGLAVDGPLVFFRENDHDLDDDGSILTEDDDEDDEDEDIDVVYTVTSLLALGRTHKPGRTLAEMKRTSVKALLKRFDVDSHFVIVASALLHKLNMLEASLKDVEDIGCGFVCMRCPPELRKRQTWVYLVRHFDYEQLWSKLAGRMSDYSNGLIEINNSHSISYLSHDEVVRIDPSYPPGACATDPHDHPDDDNGPGMYRCQLCYMLGMPYEEKYRTCVEVHVRAKHGVEPNIVEILQIA